MRPIKIVLTLAIVMFFTLPVMAQKFAYVNSQEILSKYQDYVDVQNRLEEIRSGYDAEYQQMVKEYQDQQAQEKYIAIEKFKYEKLGPEGEFYQKSMEFSKPIIDKINNLIAKVGEEEGYDFIFDAASGSLVHALPKYDITQKIIDELNKNSTSTSTNKSTTK
ncbi:MAG: OmpH family outer membrane protein [Calditrichaceae bacterium]